MRVPGLIAVSLLILISSCSSIQKAKYATVDFDRVEDRIGNKICLLWADKEELESLSKMKEKIHDAKKKLIAETDNEMFEDRTEEIGELQGKYESAIDKLARRRDLENNLKSFVSKNFGDRYVMIIEKDRNPFAGDDEFLVNNMERVDITKDLIELISKKLENF